MTYFLLIALALAAADLFLYFFFNEWRFCKLIYLRRVIYLFFHRCPRCGNKVNFTRNGAAVCPECGRRV